MEYSFKDFVAGKIIVTVDKSDMAAFKCKVDGAGIPVPNNLLTHINRFYVRFNSLVGDFCPGGDMPRIPFRTLSDFYAAADFFAGRVACKCETREEYDALMRECEKAGKVWNGGTKPTNKDGFKAGGTYTLGDPDRQGKLMRCTDTGRPASCRSCRSDDCGHKNAVPFSVLFPSDPWADFLAGKCYLRVTKQEWAEFAKRCEAAGVYYRMHARNLAAYPSDCEVKGAVYAAYNIEDCPDLGLSSAGENNRHHLPCLDFASIRKPAPVAPAPHPVKVGDRIRILMDRACSADVKKGDVFKVKTVHDTVGGIYVDHCQDWGFGAEHYEIVTEPEPVKFKVGDIVRGIDPNKYTITNTNMTRGEVVAIDKCSMRVKVLEHKNRKGMGIEYDVDPAYFALVETPAPAAPKYKVGDRFKVTGGGLVFNNGDIVELAEDDGTRFPFFNRISDGQRGCKCWDHVKPISTSSFPRIEITTDGRVTTATLYEDGKPVKTGKATCSPEDEFDMDTGATIAYNRMRFGRDFNTPDFGQFIRLHRKMAALADEIKEATSK